MPEALVSAEQLRAFRTRRRVSQAAFATMIGASTRTIEDWEAGRRAPPAQVWFALRHIEAQEMLRKQIDLMRNGGMRVRDNEVDVTDAAIAQAEAQIAEYDRLFARAEWSAPDDA